MNQVNIFHWVSAWLAPPELEPSTSDHNEATRAFKASLSHLNQTNAKHRTEAGTIRKKLDSIDREMLTALGVNK